MWVTVPDAKPGTPPPEPVTDDELWTDVEYVIEAAEYSLSHSHYAGDALPIHNPWLGPDQVAAWLGAEMTLRPRDFTSWVKPFVTDWSEHPKLAIDPANHWWKLYLEIVRRLFYFGFEFFRLGSLAYLRHLVAAECDALSIWIQRLLAEQELRAQLGQPIGVLGHLVLYRLNHFDVGILQILQ